MNVGTMSRLLGGRGLCKAAQTGGLAISKYQAVSYLAKYRPIWRLPNCYTSCQLDAGENTNLCAANTKLFVSERFKSMTVKLMQLYSGKGYEADSEIARVLQDSLASTVYSGTSEVQRNIIARWMGC
jgi:alkylation response protein AidB-like acyl-CoA dehydrogenase